MKISVLAIIFSILFFVPNPTLTGQNWQLFKKNDSLGCRTFETDALMNVFVLTYKNEILKYDRLGFFEVQYSNRKFGAIGQVDASNAFKIGVLYPNFQMLQIMNNDVNPILTVVLADLGLSRVTCMAIAEDGSTIWFYDAGKKQLQKFAIEPQGLRLQTTVSLTQCQPQSMVFRNKTLYLSDPEKGVVVCDVFGKELNIINVKAVQYMQVVGAQVFLKTEKTFEAYNQQTFKAQPVKLPAGTRLEQNMRLQKGRLFVQEQTSIFIYDDK
jgi:hypothetical protein